MHQHHFDVRNRVRRTRKSSCCCKTFLVNFQISCLTLIVMSVQEPDTFNPASYRNVFCQLLNTCCSCFFYILLIGLLLILLSLLLLVLGRHLKCCSTSSCSTHYFVWIFLSLIINTAVGRQSRTQLVWGTARCPSSWWSSALPHS